MSEITFLFNAASETQEIFNIIMFFFIIIFVKRWHHTNSTAIMSYIFNTFSNPRLAHN